MKLNQCIFTCLFIIIGFCGFSQTYTISKNNRFLMKDNTPFFWMGDTAWELFHRLDREEAEFYLKKRAAQGFTVIQCVALAELDGLNTPNTYGDKPLINNDITQANEAYFKHVDFIIDKAAEVGLTIAFLPTWGDKLFKSHWGTGPEILNVANAKIYGKWLGMRYKNKKNMIWILGGDRNPREGSQDVEVWRSMAEGITEAHGGKDKVMMSFHPQSDSQGASRWFHTDDWLDFNMFQNGHCRDTPIYDNIKGSYDRKLIKPVLDGEPLYEDHPVCFNPVELGTSSPYDVRRYAYLNVFAGAFGHTYGCHDIWQMYSSKREGINQPHFYWSLAIDLPGAKQMKYLRRLIESRSMLDRIPDQSLILESNLASNERIQATRGNDYAFIYVSAGKTVTVNMGKISGNQINAYWFDPRNGKVEDLGKFENKGTKQFTPITLGYGQDWILVLDDAAKYYQKP